MCLPTFAEVGKDAFVNAAREIAGALKHVSDAVERTVKITLDSIASAWPYLLGLLGHFRAFSGFCVVIAIVIPLVIFGGIANRPKTTSFLTPGSGTPPRLHSANHGALLPPPQGWKIPTETGDSLECEHFELSGANAFARATPLPNAPPTWARALLSISSSPRDNPPESEADTNKALSILPQAAEVGKVHKSVTNHDRPGVRLPSNEMKRFLELSSTEQMCFVRGLHSAGASELEIEPFEHAIHDNIKKEKQVKKWSEKKSEKSLGLRGTFHSLFSFNVFFLCVILMVWIAFFLFTEPHLVMGSLQGGAHFLLGNLKLVGNVAFWVGYAMNVLAIVPAFCQQESHFFREVLGLLLRLAWAPMFFRLTRLFSHSDQVIQIVLHIILVGSMYVQALCSLVC